MKKHATYFTLFILLAIVFIGCEKKNTPEPGTVELYLLESYEADGFMQIDESSILAQQDPLIAYAEFISYNSQKHIFKLAESAINKIENLEHTVNGKAFAIKADNELIYTGYFWPSYSSMACNWVVADPFMMEYYGGLKIEIGYPGLLEGTEIPDKRNHSRIIDIFKVDGKLIE